MTQTRKITDRNEAIGELTEKIKDVRFAMLTTAKPDGRLRTRPMATQEVAFGGDLWFFTDANSAKVKEIQANPQVTLGYADPGKNLWVSVTGAAEISRDRAKMKELWNPVLKAFFPDGLPSTSIGTGWDANMHSGWLRPIQARDSSFSPATLNPFPAKGSTRE
jgi:general stress protein 26